MLNSRNGTYGTSGTVIPNSEIKQEIKKLDERVTETESRLDGLQENVVTENVTADNVTVSGTVSTDRVESDSVLSNSFNGNTASIATVSSNTIGTNTLNANTVNAGSLTVSNKVNELSVGTLHTDTFNPTEIDTGTIDADNATVGNATVTTASINRETVGQADITDADIQNASVENASITSLTGNTVSVQTIQADSVTSSSTVSSDEVQSRISTFQSSVIDSLKAGNIVSKGFLNADPQQESHYSIDIPNYDNALVHLSSTYSDTEKWSVQVMKARNTAYISISESTLNGVLDISYNDGKIRIRASSDGVINYSLITNNDEAKLTVSPLGDHYMPYYYVPQKLNTYTLLGYDDSTSEFYIPGTLKLYQLQAEYVQYEEISVKVMRTERIELPLSHDESGSAIDYTFGNPRDYVAVSDDGLVTEFHTPVESATNGALSSSTALVSESAVTDYNGTKETIDPITEETITEYPITELGDEATVHGKLTVEDDTLIDGTLQVHGDLYVDGTTHTVEEETVVSEGDTILLRANNNSPLGTNLSGIVINKYNGTDDLGIVADCDGTLRVGTGTGTDTTYPVIYHNIDDNKWYTDIDDPSTEVSPQGNLTSWTSKTEEADYTEYTGAVFTVFNRTSLEPVLTRDESSDMTDGQIICWNCSGNKAKTTNCIADTVTFASCVNVEEDIDIDGNAVIDGCSCVCTCLGTPHIVSNVIDICSPPTSPSCTDGGCICGWDATFDNSVLVCGDFRVCGSAIIHGLTSDCVAVESNSCNHEMYPSFVCRNNLIGQQAELLYTDADLHYNPSDNVLTVPNIDGTCVHSQRVISDCDTTAGCVITEKVYSPQTSNCDTNVCILSHKCDNTNTVTAKACSNGKFYQNVLCRADNYNLKVPFTDLTGSVTGLTSLNVDDGFTYNPTTNNLCVGSICALCDLSCFCGIDTCYDINFYCDSDGSLTAYIYCDGSFCFGSDGGSHQLCGGTFCVNEPAYLACSATVCGGANVYGGATVCGSLSLVGPIGSQLTIHNTCYADTYAFCQGSNGLRVYCNGNLQGYWCNGTYYGNVCGTTSVATSICTSVSAPNTCNLVYAVMADNDFFRIQVGGSSNGGYVELATADDGTEPIYVSQYTGIYSSLTRRATLLDASGNTSFPGNITTAGYDVIHTGGGQTINCTLTVYGGSFASGTHTAMFKAYSQTTGYGYSGGSYIGHYNPNYDGMWGYATFGFWNAETDGICPGICVDRAGCVWTDNDLLVCGNACIDSELYACQGQYFGANYDVCIHDINGNEVFCAYDNCLGVGFYSGLDKYGTAVGCCAVACCGATSLGYFAMACGTYATALGCYARAFCTGSVAIGALACANGTCSVAIGCCASNGGLARSIAIGCCACTYYYNNASVDIVLRAGCTRIIAVSWRCGAMQCDIYKAIISQQTISCIGGQSVTHRCDIHNAVMGSYGGTEISFWRFDKNESPFNIDLWNHSGCHQITIYQNCTATVACAGQLAFIGSA